MHSAIAAEREDGFDIGDVAEVTRQKMVHRHPHVFGDVAVSGADEVVVNWEKLKAREKGERLSVLEGVPTSLPALAYALGVQKRPARLGFDETPELLDALAWSRRALEELEELTERPPEVQAGATPAAAAPGGHSAGAPPAPPEYEDAVGELLFAVVAVARRLRVNPEDALRRRATRFAGRFTALEASARAEAVDLHGIDRDDWARRWEESAQEV